MFTGVRLKEKVKLSSKLVRGIGHKHRLAIVYLLAHEPMEAREIVANLDLPQNLVAHHLKAMHEAGWVVKDRVGRSVTYRLNEKAFTDLVKLIRDTPLGHILLFKRFRANRY